MHFDLSKDQLNLLLLASSTHVMYLHKQNIISFTLFLCLPQPLLPPIGGVCMRKLFS